MLCMHRGNRTPPRAPCAGGSQGPPARRPARPAKGCARTRNVWLAAMLARNSGSRRGYRPPSMPIRCAVSPLAAASRPVSGLTSPLATSSTMTATRAVCCKAAANRRRTMLPAGRGAARRPGGRPGGSCRAWAHPGAGAGDAHSTRCPPKHQNLPAVMGSTRVEMMNATTLPIAAYDHLHTHARDWWAAAAAGMMPGSPKVATGSPRGRRAGTPPPRGGTGAAGRRTSTTQTRRSWLLCGSGWWWSLRM